MTGPKAEALARRARHFTSTAAGAWALFLLVNAANGRWITSALDAVITVLTVVAALLASRVPILSMHAVLGLAVLGLVGTATLSGYGSSIAVWWLIVVPLMGGYVLPKRPAGAWLAVTVAALATIHVLGWVAPMVPEFIPGAGQQLLAQLAMLSVLVVVAISVESTVRDERSAQVASVENARLTTARLEERNAELAIARKNAEAFAQSRSDFASAVSHEIRTPLNGILGMAQLLRDEADPSRIKDYSEELLRSGGTLLRLVNNVMDYSRSREGQLPVVQEAFSLCDAIEDAVQLYAAQAWAADIDLAYIPGPGVPEQVTGDGAAIQQIVANLVGNALRFTTDGSVRVTTARVEENTILLSVIDTGVGIDAKRQDTIWAPWVRGGTDRVGGTGLGLALVHRMVQALRGTISLSSVLGKGTTFDVRLPLVPAPNVLPERTDLPRKILVAVQLPTSGEAIVARCKRLGAKVSWVASRKALASSLRNGRWETVVVESTWIGEVPTDCPARILVFEGSPTPSNRSDEWVAHIRTPVRTDQVRAALGNSTERRDHTVRQSSLDASLAKQFPHQVLVVEDNATNQRVLSLMLQRMGYTATIVGDGRSAVDLMTHTAFDLILMDRSMPVMDGITASKAILRMRPQTRIVLVSAGYDAAQREECIRVGVREFLDKPVTADRLRAVLMGEVSQDNEAGPVSPTASTAPLAESNPRPHMQDAFSKLSQICGGDRSELSNLVGVWTDSAIDRLGIIQKSLENGDMDVVARTAHMLKGSSGTFGAIDVTRFAADLEQLAMDGAELNTLQHAAQKLDKSTRHAIRRMDQLLAT